MKSCKDIDFLDNYWIEAKRIADDTKSNLSQGVGTKRKPIFSKGGIKMYIVKFSDLKNTWLPEDIIYNVSGRSKTLSVLADKICTMIYKGRADAVKPMLRAIVSNNVKKLVKGKGGWSTKNESLGHGHFRWNYGVHTLNSMEIRHLKTYFKL